MRSLAYVLFLFLCSNLSFANDKRAIIWGGNCNKNDVNFAGPFSDLYKVLKTRNWDVHAAFGTGHDDSQIPRDAGAKFPGNFNDGSTKSLYDFLDQAIMDAQKTPNSVSEVFIDVFTHGTMGDSTNVHEWTLPDCQTLSADDQGLNDRLAKLKALNVRIGIQDNSCYSGGSIKSLKNNACVMSASSEFQPSYGDLSTTINALANPELHPSLADIYNAEITKHVTEGYFDLLPQLSGLKTNDQFSRMTEESNPMLFFLLNHREECVLSDQPFRAFLNLVDSLSGLISVESIPAITDRELGPNPSEMKEILASIAAGFRRMATITDQINAKAADMNSKIKVNSVVVDINKIAPFAAKKIADFNGDVFEGVGEKAAYSIYGGKLFLPVYAIGLNPASSRADSFFIHMIEPESEDGKPSALRRKFLKSVDTAEALARSQVTAAQSVSIKRGQKEILNLVNESKELLTEIGAKVGSLTQKLNNNQVIELSKLRAVDPVKRTLEQSPFTDCENFKF